MKTHLSKSVALSGRQCVKLLFRELHEPQLAAQVKVTDRLPSRGLEVHENARRQYPDEILFRHDDNLTPTRARWPQKKIMLEN